MAGAPGFEPGNGGTKNRCLTAWLRPNKSNRSNRLGGLITASTSKRNRLITKSRLSLQCPRRTFSTAYRHGQSPKTKPPICVQPQSCYFQGTNGFSVFIMLFLL